MKRNDIINKNFSRVFLGYDAKEVDLFLDDIIRDFERLEQELEIANIRIQTLVDELKNGTSQSNTVEEKETAKEAE